MTSAYARLIATVFASIQAKGAEVRRKRYEESTTNPTVLEYYEGALLSVLSLMKSRAELAGFALDTLGMSGFDPVASKVAFDAAFETMIPVPLDSGHSDDSFLITPREYLRSIRALLKQFADEVRCRPAQEGTELANHAYSKALEDVIEVLDSARARAGLDSEIQ
jgi:hypothetical protein